MIWQNFTLFVSITLKDVKHETEDLFCVNAIYLKAKHSFAIACAANLRLFLLSSTTTRITSVLLTLDLCYASWNLWLLDPYEYNTTYWIQRGHHSHDFVFDWLVFLHIHCCRSGVTFPNHREGVSSFNSQTFSNKTFLSKRFFGIQSLFKVNSPVNLKRVWFGPL